MTDELIRKSDVLEIVSGCHTSGLTFGTTARIEDLPAVTVAVKPLVWPDFREGGTCGRPAHVQYFITQDHDGDFWTHFDGEVFSTLEAAQANCEAHWQRNMQVFPAPVQPDPAAIREAAAVVEGDAERFEKADWFWRTMDPDDCGDTPEEAINRAMVGRFCVCEVASSYAGPTRYGFIAPVLDADSDDEEFVHFATQQEAVEAAKARAALIQKEPTDDC